MNDTITLTYNLKQPFSSWDEKVEFSVPLADISDFTQLTKVLSALISFFVKCGFTLPLVLEAYEDITDQLQENLVLADDLEEPNYDSPEEEIDEHIKNIEKYFTAPDLTLVQFKAELKKEAFVQYLYQIYLDDNEERIVN